MLARTLLLGLTLAACGTTPETTASAASTSEPGPTTGPLTTDPTTTATTTTTTTATTDLSTTDTPTTDTGEPPAIDYTQPGIHPVGSARFTLTVGDRTLPVELWYPADLAEADAAAQGHPIADFVPDGPDRAALDGLLAELSPAGQIGTRLQTRSARDAAPAAGGPWPLLVFSHCFNCVRFSAFSLAEHLASHGFLVAAPDHTGGTLFDALAGTSADLGEPFLKIRAADLGALLDAILSDAPALPAPLRGLADPERVGVFGHSFGAVTAGRLAQDDPRVRAALPIAAPVENPIFPDTHLVDIHVPLLTILAEEDNSIGAIGNNLIVANFKAQNPPARLIRVRDAGHWGFTDICGLTEAFSAGCGEGLRQTVKDQPFTYLDVALARGIARAYALAFFDLHLRDNPSARAYLDNPDPAEIVTVESRE